eukprot:9502759-Pyramimonas_sp.AAC.1
MRVKLCLVLSAVSEEKLSGIPQESKRNLRGSSTILLNPSGLPQEPVKNIQETFKNPSGILMNPSG